MNNLINIFKNIKKNIKKFKKIIKIFNLILIFYYFIQKQ